MPESTAYEFACYRLAPATRKLLRDGMPVKLGGRAFDVLVALVERRDRTVSKSELMDIVWPALVVEENNLQVQVVALRKLLGPQVIETIPGRGYRFTATIEAVTEQTAQHAPLASTEARKTSLPRNLTQLFGRDADVIELAALTLRHPLVSIVGMGGVGKSSLAREVLPKIVPRFASGVCWVDLATLSAGSSADETVPAAVSNCLGFRLLHHDTLAAVVEAVRPLEVLIALDNAEHVRPAVARFVEAVLQSAPRARFLVSSQIPLNASGEQLYRLGPLSLPSDPVTAVEAIRHGAVALFVARAQAQDRRFALSDENVEQVTTLCRNLDGLPLAIELAAGRFASLGLRQLCVGLEQRLRLLTHNLEGAPARQQTLRASLEWSHGLLGSDEQKVLRRLAVFVGIASLETIRQVAGDERLDEWAVLDALGVLVDRSFVNVYDEGDTLCYRMLDTPRTFALERLAASGEMAAIQARHMAAICELFERGYADVWGGRIGVECGFERFSPELDNVRIAFAWALTHDASCAVALCGTLLGTCPYPSIPERAAMWRAVEPLLDADVTVAHRARAALEASNVASNLQGTKTRFYVELAIRQFRELSDRFMLYRALAKLVRLVADKDKAATNAALTEMRTLEDSTWPSIRLLCGAQAEVVAAFDSPRQALMRSYQLMALEEDAGDGHQHALACVVEIELGQRQAAAALRDALKLVGGFEGTRYTRLLSHARARLLQAWLASDEVGQARTLALVGWRDAVFHGHTAIWSDGLALLAALEGRVLTCALLSGFAESRYAMAKRQRENSEVLTIERARALARACMKDEEFDQLTSLGRQIGEGEVGCLALAEKDYQPLW